MPNLAPMPPITATDRVRQYVQGCIAGQRKPSIATMLGDCIEGVVQDRLRSNNQDVLHTEDAWYAYDPSFGIWKRKDTVWLKATIDKWYRDTTYTVPNKSFRSEIFEGVMVHVHKEEIRWGDVGNIIITSNNIAYDLDQNKEVIVQKDWYLREENLLAVEWAKGGSCPQWDKAVDEVMAHIDPTDRPSVITLIEEWMATTLLRHNKPRALSKCLFLYGERRTGKSTILDVPRQLYGEELATAIDLQELQGFGAQALIGKAVWLSDEIKVGTVLNDSVIKRVITNEPISVKVKYERPFEGRLNMSIGLAGNALPKIEDTSDAVYDRILFVPCDTIIDPAKEDATLRDKLIYELPAILQRLIERLRDVRARGYFVIPPSLNEKAEEIKINQDPLRDFLAQGLVKTNAQCAVENPDIQTAYRGYIASMFGDDTAKEMRFNATQISKRISEVYPTSYTGKTKKGTVRAKFGIHFTEQGKAWLDKGLKLSDIYYKTDQQRLKDANINNNFSIQKP